MTQNDQILDYLKAGRTLTPMVALDRFGCFRLAARVKELREAGYGIKTTMGRMGRSKRVAVYSLG